MDNRPLLISWQWWRSVGREGFRIRARDSSADPGSLPSSLGAWESLLFALMTRKVACTRSVVRVQVARRSVDDIAPVWPDLPYDARHETAATLHLWIPYGTCCDPWETSRQQGCYAQDRPRPGQHGPSPSSRKPALKVRRKPSDRMTTTSVTRPCIFVLPLQRFPEQKSNRCLSLADPRGAV